MWLIRVDKVREGLIKILKKLDLRSRPIWNQLTTVITKIISIKHNSNKTVNFRALRINIENSMIEINQILDNQTTRKNPTEIQVKEQNTL